MAIELITIRIGYEFNLSRGGPNNTVLYSESFIQYGSKETGLNLQVNKAGPLTADELRSWPGRSG